MKSSTTITNNNYDYYYYYYCHFQEVSAGVRAAWGEPVVGVGFVGVGEQRPFGPHRGGQTGSRQACCHHHLFPRLPLPPAGSPLPLQW